ncbi:uncharacterized protein BYT42DRAFT_607374, partial [Radiomyces spectabilis]|uniref:uncharacterized protein n=1 Tax=Radiomyces spectabilis TaxID=64574 RepID=UPI002220214E
MSNAPPTVTTARLMPKRHKNEDASSEQQEIASLKAKVRSLERKILKMDHMIAECTQVAPVKIKNLDLNKKIRQHYRYLGEQEQLFWNLDTEFNESTNPKVAKALIDFINQLPDEIRKLSWTPRMVRHKVCKHHNHLRTNYQEKKKDAAGWKLIQKLKTHRNNKFHERHAAFYVAGAEVSTYFAGAEMLLVSGLMSDEEDIIQDNCIIGRRVLR